MQFSPDQQAALNMMMDGKSVFLTGGAGTGKSAVTNAFLQKCGDRNIVALASTGAAALLIKGQTVASFFGLGIDIHKPGASYLREKTKKLLEKADGFIIDEVSMCRIDVVQAIHDKLRAFPKGDGPFFGYQVIFVGDFAQLPPVIPRSEKEIVEFHYGKGKEFAFQVECWKDLEIANLTTVHRQSGDPKFKDWLNVLRMGDVPDLAYINKRVQHAKETSVCLVGKNQTAEMINAKRMAALNTKNYRFSGSVAGNISTSDTKVPLNYDLKSGARVIICANNREEGYANGSTGTFLRTGNHPDLGKSAIVQLDDGRTVEVTENKWEKYSHSLDIIETPKLDINGKEVLDNKGNVVFVAQSEWVKTLEGVQYGIPLIPGWAITIHRSQGMSLPDVHIDLTGMFSSGQAYVAMSRATSLEGLTLEKPMAPRDIRLSSVVREYMDSISEDVVTIEAEEINEEKISLDYEF